MQRVIALVMAVLLCFYAAAIPPTVFVYAATQQELETEIERIDADIQGYKEKILVLTGKKKNSRCIWMLWRGESQQLKKN